MPIYLFVCKSCLHQFEKIQKMDDKNPACIHCGAETEKGVVPVSKFVWGKGGAYTG